MTTCTVFCNMFIVLYLMNYDQIMSYCISFTFFLNDQPCQHNGINLSCKLQITSPFTGFEKMTSTAQHFNTFRSGPLCINNSDVCTVAGNL